MLKCIVASLNAYARQKDLDGAVRLHADILNRGLLGNNPYIDSSLINVYAKCGVLAKAQQLHDELSVRSTVSWNALIAGYARHGLGHEALNCFECMECEGSTPDAVTFTCVLKACGNTGSIDKGKQIHDDVLSRGLLEKDNVLGTALVDMYAKCGLIFKAQEVHDGLPARDIVSWSALITGYVEQGNSYEALTCYERMKVEVVSPNAISFTCILKSCNSMASIAIGKRIHNEILNRSLLEKDVVLGTSLVDMYAKCGLLENAQEVHDGLPVHDLVSWSALMAGYAQHSHSYGALDCYQRLQAEGFVPDAVTSICSLKACSNTKSVTKGKLIQIVSKDLIVKDGVLGTALVDMYVECGMLEEAKRAHEQLHIQSIGSWNSLIGGYARWERGQEAFDCFQQMQSEGFSADEMTFTCLLNACGSAQALEKGKQIHDEISSRGLLEKDIVLGSALVDMYAKCGILIKAHQVHDNLPVQSVVSWSALISGYAQLGQCHEALECLEKMQRQGFSPDSITFICVLKACGNVGSLNEGTLIHDEIASRGLLDKDIILGNTLIDMYVKCRMLASAQKVHDDLCGRNIISWSILISGYSQGGLLQEALNCVEKMQHEGISPNAVIFSCILKACGISGAISKGKQIHDKINCGSLLQEDVVLGNALVDMYVKFGRITKAREVLQELPKQDVVSWNTVIVGYGQQGQCHEALTCFKQMQHQGIAPNAVTFVCVLDACNHAGLSYEAEMCFESMSKKYDITPNLEHYTCMVAVSGDAGKFDKALSIINSMPSSNHVSVWLALLGACRKWGNVSLGNLAFYQAVKLDKRCAGAYIIMSSILANAGKQEEAEKIQSLRVENVTEKKSA